MMMTTMSRRSNDAFSDLMSTRASSQLSRASFPLCMQELHRGLKETHHLKHQGRLQFGLFLKGIGLSLDEALKFFRQEFMRVMGEEKVGRYFYFNCG